MIDKGPAPGTGVVALQYLDVGGHQLHARAGGEFLHASTHHGTGPSSKVWEVIVDAVALSIGSEVSRGMGLDTLAIRGEACHVASV